MFAHGYFSNDFMKLELDDSISYFFLFDCWRKC